MGKARNLSVLLAADGQVEDAKIDGVAASKLTGALPAIDGASLTNVVAVSGVATDATKLPLAGGAMTGAITTNSTFDTRDVATDGTKLDTIETSATADQTDAEIKAAVNNATDSNTFTDADHTKLNDIEDDATADQTGAQIKTAYEAETSAFTDAQFTKLAAIEASADVTDATNVVAALTAGTGITISAGGTVAAGPLALTTVQTASSQSAHLALTAEEGDIVVRSDENKSYVHNGGSAGNMNDYTLLATPTDAVLSVNGQTGAISAAQLKSAVIPSQSGNSGKFLTTDATNTSWATVDALPAQSGNAGKYLTTDATNASWATLDTDSNTTTKGLYEHAHTIAANYSITSGNNALAAGPMTINSGVSVTVPSGSTLVIA